MSQGGDDAALLIANVHDQYQDALLVDFNDPLDTIYTALRVDFPVAAVVPSALLALPTLQLRPAPVFTVVAEDIPQEDFSQEGIKARAHQHLQFIRYRLSSDHGIAPAFHLCQ